MFYKFQNERTTWREKFIEILKKTGDSLKDLKFNISKPKFILDKEFDDGFGRSEGPPFIAWSNNFVYFTRDYDGIDYVPRNPK